MEKIPLLVIAGPTASGKTDLAVRCAERFNGEVISADSMQIYKGMDIATAKPSREEMRGVPHHLIDFLPTDSVYSAADFASDAGKLIKEINSAGRLPILVGGTGLYIDCVVNNIKFIEAETDFALRERLEREFDDAGAENMLARLREIDPETAERLNLSDKKRIIRALEVYYQTGKTFSEVQNASRLEPPPYNTLYLVLDYRSREKLYGRINERVELMLQKGLVNEARDFFSRPRSETSSQAIGYKELKSYLDGEITLDEAAENLKKSTRHYAKRQLTWFKKNRDAVWLYPDDYETPQELLFAAEKLIKEAFFDGAAENRE